MPPALLLLLLPHMRTWTPVLCSTGCHETQRSESQVPVPVAGVGAAAGDRDSDSVRAAVYVRTVVRIVILSVPARGAETDRPERVHYNDMGGGCSLQGWPRRPRAQQGAAGDRDRVCDVYAESRWIGVRLRGSR